jgi:methyltransferase
VGLAVVAACLLAETVISKRHERALRSRGAVEPSRDVYAWMRVAYPAGFIGMALEGWYRGSAGLWWAGAGAAIFCLAKALKYAAIAALGERWSFRVLVLPGAPLVRSGPYRWIDHPNYVAVVGELVGAACYFGAASTGPIALLVFGALLLRRLSVERRALAP